MNKYQVFKSGANKGQPKTLTDRVVRYLVEGRKAKEVQQGSKYRCFLQNGLYPWWVGKAGGVRAGRVSSDTVSITDTVHAYMKAWERNQEIAAAEAEKNINCLDRVIR